MSKINVYSEIGRLKKVMLHRPGDEIDGVIPQTMPRHLFDDIPWKKGAQYEHDCFADILRSEGHGGGLHRRPVPGILRQGREPRGIPGAVPGRPRHP